MPKVEVIDLTEEAEYEYMYKRPNWFICDVSIMEDHVAILVTVCTILVWWALVCVICFINEPVFHESVINILMRRWWWCSLSTLQLAGYVQYFVLRRWKQGNCDVKEPPPSFLLSSEVASLQTCVVSRRWVLHKECLGLFYTQILTCAKQHYNFIYKNDVIAQRCRWSDGP
jgi:hypothetical protein